MEEDFLDDKIVFRSQENNLSRYSFSNATDKLRPVKRVHQDDNSFLGVASFSLNTSGFTK